MMEPPQDELEIMANHLLHLRTQLADSPEAHSPQSESPQRPSHSSRSSPSLPAAIRNAYEQFLQQNSLPADHESKIQWLLDTPLNLGTAVALFEMVHYFRGALSADVLEEIRGKASEGLVRARTDEEIRCYGELLAACGGEEESVCQLMAQWLLDGRDFQLPFLLLASQGDTGLAYLCDIASRDLAHLSGKVLDHLSRTPAIISAIVVPTLLSDAANAGHPRQRDVALAALNRLGGVIGSAAVLECLCGLLQDAAVDKKLLLATIRAAGPKGEELLLSLLSSKVFSETLSALALGVLSWRPTSQPVLRLKAIQYTMENCFLPGRLYTYEGQVQPWDFQQQLCSDSLCLSSREFMMQLSDKLRQGGFKGSEISRQGFVLAEVLDLQNEGPNAVSQEVVRLLTTELKSKSAKIREIALLQLGNIGQPEGKLAADSVVKCLSDPDSSIRSAACWTLSRICDQPPRKAEAKLTQLLRDNFWKVRTSACIALGLLLKTPTPQCLEGLVKVLQDGSIPKATVCEALARVGAEQLLLELLRGSGRGDFKLREAVIASFEFANPCSPHLSSLVEEVLKHSRDPRIATRQLCLLTLQNLRKRAEGQLGQLLGYFQPRSLLPFYYCFLDDPAPKIRTLAAQAILSLGPQAELVFIQGITKAPPLAKIECIRCLGRLGVQNFRALVLGLRDEDERVRKAAGETLVGSFSVEEVVQEFGRRQNQSISLVCNLREVVGGLQDESVRSLMRGVMQGLEEMRKTGTIRHWSSQNRRVNN